MSIWAPQNTGVTGGRRIARQAHLEEEASRANTENTRAVTQGQKIQNKTKQEEFFDWMDAAEERRVNRQVNVDRGQRELDNKEILDETFEEKAALDLENIESQRRMLPHQEQGALDTAAQASFDQKMNNVTRAYHYFGEAIDGNPENAPAAYQQARQVIIESFPDPLEGEAWLESHGIGAEFSPDAINAFSGLSTAAIYDAVHSREMNLQNLKLLTAAAGKTTSTKDLRADPMTKENRANLGSFLNGYLRDGSFGGFQGALDEGVYTGAKGTVVDTIALFAEGADAANISGDASVTRREYLRVSADVMNAGIDSFRKEGWFMGTANTGDEFDAEGFLNVAHAAMGTAIVKYETLKAFDPELDFYSYWQQVAPGILKDLEKDDTYTNPQEGNSGTPPPPGGTHGAGTDGLTAPAPTDAKAIDTRLKEIEKILNDMTPSQRRKLDAKKLMGERKRLRKEKAAAKKKASIPAGEIVSDIFGITYGNTGSQDTDVEGL